MTNKQAPASNATGASAAPAAARQNGANLVKELFLVPTKPQQVKATTRSIYNSVAEQLDMGHMHDSAVLQQQQPTCGSTGPYVLQTRPHTAFDSRQPADKAHLTSVPAAMRKRQLSNDQPAGLSEGPPKKKPQCDIQNLMQASNDLHTNLISCIDDLTKELQETKKKLEAKEKDNLKMNRRIDDLLDDISIVDHKLAEAMSKAKKNDKAKKKLDKLRKKWTGISEILDPEMMAESEDDCDCGCTDEDTETE